jgi:hypothetical protein
MGQNMHSDESRTDPGEPSVSSHANHAGGNATAKFVSTTAGRRVPFWVLTLGSGLVAGALAGVGSETLTESFTEASHFPANYKSLGTYEKENARAAASRAASNILERRKATVAYGLLGLALGAFLGLTGGLAGGSVRSSLGGAAAGGVTGALAGAGLSAVLVPVFFRLFDPERGLILFFLTDAGIFAGVGAAGGLALAWGSGNRRIIGRCLIGGLGGSLLGTFASVAIDSLAFPLMSMFQPMPAERAARVLAHLCVAAGTGLFAGLAAGAVSRKSAPSV